MEWNNVTIPTDAFSEDANLNLADEKNDIIMVSQQLSIQQPKREEYVTISKWNLNLILKRCEYLKKQPKIRSDIYLTIGSLLLGAFTSLIFSGVDLTKSWWLLMALVLLPVVGCGFMIAAYFQKREEHNNAKKVAEDVDEIISHIYQEDKEA